MLALGDAAMTLTEGPVSFSPEFLRQTAVFLVVAVLVALFLPKERRHVAKLFGLFAAGVLLRGLALLLHQLGMPGASQTGFFLSLLLEWIAYLNLAAVVLFSVLFENLRVASPRILRDLAVGLSYVALLLYLFSQYRVDVTGIVATSAVVTAVVGFSLQDVLVNVMAGISLQMDGSIAVGDWVKVAEQVGRVREVGWRRTVLETRNGDTVVVPNVHFMKNPALVQGRRSDVPRRERRWVFFGVDYRTSPERVLEVVTDALRREEMPNVATEPLPQVLLMGFEASWARYAVRYWLTDLLADDMTDSAVRARIFYALKRASIPLSIPAQEVFVQPEDAEHRARQKAKETEARLAALESVSIFRSLTAEEKTLLAEGLVAAPYAAGEAIVVQGRAVHHLYVLAQGRAEVRVSVEGAPQRTVATLEAPTFFGEMGMLTGEPRRATVVAATEVECWRLEKERFQEVLAARPRIAEEISQVLATRDVNLAAAREGLSEEARRLRIASEHRSLTERIQAFFAVS
jgi:small-conductance mechanosensitive channel/CRP-like cAMP-binding protein